MSLVENKKIKFEVIIEVNETEEYLKQFKEELIDEFPYLLNIKLEGFEAKVLSSIIIDVQ